MHVFIVNEKTFKYHLEYKFVGTGASNKAALFLDEPNTEKIHSSTERNLVGMIADISRVRKGDKVIFYLTGAGKFYGVFKVVDIAFYDKIDDNYLEKELGKMLSFRVLIEPDNVYAKGITERECLDSLKDVEKPYEMCWSLIYRKLKGNRGCTMILDYEFDRIHNLIKKKNKDVELTGDNFSYDPLKEEIIEILDSKKYLGNQYSIDIFKRLLHKEKTKKAFEVHLQAYILQNYDRGQLYDFLFEKTYRTKWIGNEVSCGVGMQRIDIMTISEDSDKVNIKIIELKQTGPYIEIIEGQIDWYVQWCIDYVVPNYINKNITIQPIVLAKKIEDIKEFKKESLQFKRNQEKVKIENVSYIAFEVEEDEIKFERVF
jgi:hypothetical protein